MRIDEKGNKYVRVSGVRWFTNVDYKERHEELVLYKSYNEKAVINTVLNGFSLNIMYWIKNNEESFEIIDGQ